MAAVVYVVSGLGGNEAGLNKFGTAAWFAIMFGGVLAAAWALWTGRRWGRGVAVFAQLLLLPVAWYLAVGSHQWVYGVPVGVVALITLVCCSGRRRCSGFRPATIAEEPDNPAQLRTTRPAPTTQA